MGLMRYVSILQLGAINLHRRVESEHAGVAR